MHLRLLWLLFQVAGFSFFLVTVVVLRIFFLYCNAFFVHFWLLCSIFSNPKNWTFFNVPVMKQLFFSGSFRGSVRLPADGYSLKPSPCSACTLGRFRILFGVLGVLGPWSRYAPRWWHAAKALCAVIQPSYNHSARGVGVDDPPGARYRVVGRVCPVHALQSAIINNKISQVASNVI